MGISPAHGFFRNRSTGISNPLHQPSRNYIMSMVFSVFTTRSLKRTVSPSSVASVSQRNSIMSSKVLVKRRDNGLVPVELGGHIGGEYFHFARILSVFELYLQYRIGFFDDKVTFLEIEQLQTTNRIPYTVIFLDWGLIHRFIRLELASTAE